MVDFKIICPIKSILRVTIPPFESHCRIKGSVFKFLSKIGCASLSLCRCGIIHFCLLIPANLSANFHPILSVVEIAAVFCAQIYKYGGGCGIVVWF